MQDANRGYVGYSRSRRSQHAIDNYEVPLSHITRDLILKFTSEYPEYRSLSTVPSGVWKYVAERLGAASWHHTSSRFNRTNHYSMVAVAERLANDGTDSWVNAYKTSSVSRDAAELKLVVVTAERWGGSRRRPRMYGHETVLCVLIGDTAYPVTDADKRHYRVTASKNEISRTYTLDEYPQLVKDYKQFKATKRAVNQVVKRLTSE